MKKQRGFLELTAATIFGLVALAASVVGVLLGQVALSRKTPPPSEATEGTCGNKCYQDYDCGYPAATCVDVGSKCHDGQNFTGKKCYYDYDCNYPAETCEYFGGECRCKSGYSCIGGACIKPTATPTPLPTVVVTIIPTSTPACTGCRGGDACLPGNSNTACGKDSEPCQNCTDQGKICVDQSCVAATTCSSIGGNCLSTSFCGVNCPDPCNCGQCAAGQYDCGSGQCCCIPRPTCTPTSIPTPTPTATSSPNCGNGTIDPGEECENNADCVGGEVCVNCQCVPTTTPTATPTPIPDSCQSLGSGWECLISIVQPCSQTKPAPNGQCCSGNTCSSYCCLISLTPTSTATPTPLTPAPPTPTPACTCPEQGGYACRKAEDCEPGTTIGTCWHCGTPKDSNPCCKLKSARCYCVSSNCGGLHEGCQWESEPINPFVFLCPDSACNEFSCSALGSDFYCSVPSDCRPECKSSGTPTDCPSDQVCCDKVCMAFNTDLNNDSVTNSLDWAILVTGWIEGKYNALDASKFLHAWAAQAGIQY